MEKREYWANPKIYNRTLYFSMLFLFIFPAYGIYKVGTSNIAIGFVLLISIITGGYFLNVHRKYKNKPVLITETSSITISDPFSKIQTITLDSIKSVKRGSNDAIVLNLEGLFKSARINGKTLFDKDKKELMEFLGANIKNS